MIGLLDLILKLFEAAVIVRTIMSWFLSDFTNPIYTFLVKITEPIIGPIRRLIPLRGIDISPMIVIILIEYFIRPIIFGL